MKTPRTLVARHKTGRTLVAPVVALLISACGGGKPPAPSSDIDESTWIVLRDSETGAADAVAPKDVSGIFVTGDPVQFSKDFLTRNADTFGILDPAQITSDGLAGTIDGGQHVVFHQEVNGVPVYGVGITVIYGPDGQLTTVVGAFQPTAGLLQATPAFDAAAAATKSAVEGFVPSMHVPELAGLSESKPQLTVIRAPEKGAFEDNAWELNYLVPGIDKSGRNGLAFVEATTGVVRGVAITDEALVGTGMGTYGEMRTFPVLEADLTSPTDAFSPYLGVRASDPPRDFPSSTPLPNAVVFAEQQTIDPAPPNAVTSQVTPVFGDSRRVWTAPLAVDAYANILEARDWFTQQISPDLWLQDQTINIRVLSPRLYPDATPAREILSETCGNAFWNWKGKQFIVLPGCNSPVAETEWDTTSHLERRTGATVAAPRAFVDHEFMTHEFAHRFWGGTTAYPSNVRHKKTQAMPQDRVVSEAIADAFAIFRERDRANNEGIRLALGVRASHGRPIRDFENPHMSYLAQPRFMLEAYTGTPAGANDVTWADHGGSHINLGIANQALAIMLRGPSIHGLAYTSNATLSWTDAKSLYFPLLGLKKTGPVVPYPTTRGGWTLKGMALAMKGLAKARGLEVPVLCAWKAVGVLNYTDADRLDTTQCVPDTPVPSDVPSGPVCAGRPDGVYCREDSTFGAVECKGGEPTRGLQCGSSQTCDSATEGQAEIQCINPCADKEEDADHPVYICLGHAKRPDRRVTVECKFHLPVDTKVDACSNLSVSDAGAPDAGSQDAGPVTAQVPAESCSKSQMAPTDGTPFSFAGVAAALLALVRRRTRGGATAAGGAPNHGATAAGGAPNHRSRS